MGNKPVRRAKCQGWACASRVSAVVHTTLAVAHAALVMSSPPPCCPPPSVGFHSFLHAFLLLLRPLCARLALRSGVQRAGAVPCSLTLCLQLQRGVLGDRSCGLSHHPPLGPGAGGGHREGQRHALCPLPNPLEEESDRKDGSGFVRTRADACGVVGTLPPAALSVSVGCSCCSENIPGSLDTDVRRWNACAGSHQGGHHSHRSREGGRPPGVPSPGSCARALSRRGLGGPLQVLVLRPGPPPPCGGPPLCPLSALLLSQVLLASGNRNPNSGWLKR